MAERSQSPPVKIVGSRELHQKLPAIMRDLENQDARYVLTVHGKPRAVLIGASTYLDLVQGKRNPSETVIGLQLSAMLGTPVENLPVDSLRGLILGGADPAPGLSH